MAIKHFYHCANVRCSFTYNAQYSLTHCDIKCQPMCVVVVCLRCLVCKFSLWNLLCFFIAAKLYEVFCLFLLPYAPFLMYTITLTLFVSVVVHLFNQVYFLYIFYGLLDFDDVTVSYHCFSFHSGMNYGSQFPGGQPGSQGIPGMNGPRPVPPQQLMNQSNLQAPLMRNQGPPMPPQLQNQLQQVSSSVAF